MEGKQKLVISWEAEEDVEGLWDLKDNYDPQNSETSQRFGI